MQTILIIDDDVTIGNPEQRVLECAGYAVCLRKKSVPLPAVVYSCGN